MSGASLDVCAQSGSARSFTFRCEVDLVKSALGTPIALVIQLEHPDGALVRTERECRTLEATEAGRYSVPVLRPGREEERRWPDVVLEANGRRSALELELSAKGTTRLQAIVDAYAAAPWFDEVVFLAAEASIAKRLARCVARAPQRPALRGTTIARTPTLRVVPWPELRADDQRARVASIQSAPSLASGAARSGR
jgi:hypothetical protein